MSSKTAHIFREPVVSIVTPSFNQRQFIEATILSVLNQDYPNIEYIVIDGGSTDGTRGIIQKYESSLAFWASEPDKGQADALRKGFQKSTGDIMGWVNSDDHLCDGAISSVVNRFKQEPHVDVVFGALKLIDGSSNTIARRRDKSGAKFDFSTLLFDCSLPQPATFWRRSIYLKVGGFDPNFQFCMDLDLWVRFALADASFVRLNDVLACARLHPLSKTSRMQSVRHGEKKIILERTLGREVKPAEMLLRGITRKTLRYMTNPMDFIRGVETRLRVKFPARIRQR